LKGEGRGGDRMIGVGIGKEGRGGTRRGGERR